MVSVAVQILKKICRSALQKRNRSSASHASHKCTRLEIITRNESPHVLVSCQSFNANLTLDGATQARKKNEKKKMISRKPIDLCDKPNTKHTSVFRIQFVYIVSPLCCIRAIEKWIEKIIKERTYMPIRKERIVTVSVWNTFDVYVSKQYRALGRLMLINTIFDEHECVFSYLTSTPHTKKKDEFCTLIEQMGKKGECKAMQSIQHTQSIVIYCHTIQQNLIRSFRSVD